MLVCTLSDSFNFALGIVDAHWRRKLFKCRNEFEMRHTFACDAHVYRHRTITAMWPTDRTFHHNISTLGTNRFASMDSRVFFVRPCIFSPSAPEQTTGKDSTNRGEATKVRSNNSKGKYGWNAVVQSWQQVFICVFCEDYVTIYHTTENPLQEWELQLEVQWDMN